MKKLISVLLIAASLLCIASCTKKDDNTAPVEGETNYVKLEMENGDSMIIELYPDEAPITVRNFKKLVSRHYYDGTVFHRVIEGFMIQGGAGAATDSIKGEFSANGVKNGIKHDRGVLSMARAMDPNSAGSQFFIMVEKAPHLDGSYAAFGRIIEGMEAADTIVNQKRNMMDKPNVPQVMKTVKIVEE